MLESTIRRGLALTASLAMAGIVALPTPAAANLGGSGNTMTSSDGTDIIRFDDGSTLDVGEPVYGATWAPDGSRAVFVTDQNELDTVRYNDPDDLWTLIDADNTVQRSDPVWSPDGDVIYWAEKPAGEPWEIEAAPAGYGWGYAPVSPGNGATKYDYTHPDVSDRGVLVAQRQQVDDYGNPIGDPEVVQIQDGVATVLLTNAANPALLSYRIAFVRSDGTYDQIYSASIADLANTVIPITRDAYDHDDPAFWGENDSLYFRIPSDNTVGQHDDYTDFGPSVIVDGLSGIPAFAPWQSNTAIFQAGSNRFKTAVKISQTHWVTADSLSADKAELAQSVTLSRSDTFADAVSGSALAAAKHGPLLLTPSTSLNPDTAAEMQRVLGTMNPESKTVYLLGGTGAISAGVADQITGMGYHVTRISGANRYATSIAIANEITDDPSVVMAATGMNFPDALGAGAAAGSFDSQGEVAAVVVLTNDRKLPAATQDYLDTWYAAHGSSDDYALFGIGGQASAAIATYPTAVPITGANRYETAAFVAQVFFTGERVAGMATGTNWPDALAGGAFLGSTHGPLVLTSASPTLDPSSAQVLSMNAPSLRALYIFGGVVPSAAVYTAKFLISGPGGVTTWNSVQSPRSMSAKPNMTPQTPSNARLTPARMKVRALALGQ